MLSLSVTSPLCNRTPLEANSAAFSGLRTTATTSCPLSTSCPATWLPTKPVAPVTKYFKVSLLLGESEVRSQKSEVRSQKSEVRSQKSEVRSQLVAGSR